MTRRAFATLLILLLSSAQTVCAEEKPHFDCAKAVDYFLGFDSKKVQNLSPDWPISLELSERIVFFKFRMTSRLGFLRSDRLQICKQQGLATYRSLVAFARARLNWLLENNEASRAFSEYQIIFKPTLGEDERKILSADLRETETKLIKGQFNILCSRLSDSKWSHFCDKEIQFESWTPEWKGFLGTEALAAVRIYDLRIAIAIANMTETETQIFIFHELAHLADTGGKLRKADLLANEEFAWAQTFELIDYLSSLGITTPEVFTKARRNVELLGLKTWVKLVVKARTTRRQR